ncbi:hypothetical protein GW17_00039901, partial [Ensete ventricosum]
VEVTTSNNIEPLLPSRVSYTHNLSRASDKPRNFRLYLRWMCVDQSNAKHVMVSWSLFLLCILILIISHFVLSYALTHYAYDMVI